MLILKIVHLDISYAQKEITIDFVNDEDKTYLDLKPKDRHVVSVRSHVYLANNNVFQYTESRHQVDKFPLLSFRDGKNINKKLDESLAFY